MAKEKRQLIYADTDGLPPTEGEESVKSPEEIHRDQIKREKIPSRSDLKTMYHAHGQLVMVIPLPDTVRVGRIIIPEKARDHMIEGHIVEIGPGVPASELLGTGDCVTWAQHNEYQMEMDGGEKFVLIPYASIILRIPRAELELIAASREPLNKPSDAGTSAEG